MRGGRQVPVGRDNFYIGMLYLWQEGRYFEGTTYVYGVPLRGVVCMPHAVGGHRLLHRASATLGSAGGEEHPTECKKD